MLQRRFIVHLTQYLAEKGRSGSEEVIIQLINVCRACCMP